MDYASNICGCYLRVCSENPCCNKADDDVTWLSHETAIYRNPHSSSFTKTVGSRTHPSKSRVNDKEKCLYFRKNIRHLRVWSRCLLQNGVSVVCDKLLFHECCTKRCIVPGWTKERSNVRTSCSLACGRFFSAWLTTVRLRPLTSHSPVTVDNVHRSYLTYLLHQHGSSSSPVSVIFFSQIVALTNSQLVNMSFTASNIPRDQQKHLVLWM